jgi:hypothetical protein
VVGTETPMKGLHESGNKEEISERWGVGSSLFQQTSLNVCSWEETPLPARQQSQKTPWSKSVSPLLPNWLDPIQDADLELPWCLSSRVSLEPKKSKKVIWTGQEAEEDWRGPRGGNGGPVKKSQHQDHSFSWVKFYISGHSYLKAPVLDSDTAFFLHWTCYC